jgi:hypothetical protein
MVDEKESVMHDMHRNSLLEAEMAEYWVADSPVQFSWNHVVQVQHWIPFATYLPQPRRPQQSTWVGDMVEPVILEAKLLFMLKIQKC